MAQVVIEGAVELFQQGLCVRLHRRVDATLALPQALQRRHKNEYLLDKLAVKNNDLKLSYLFLAIDKLAVVSLLFVKDELGGVVHEGQIQEVLQLVHHCRRGRDNLLPIDNVYLFGPWKI